MDESKKSGFKSAFKFNFTTASLTPNRKKDPTNGSGLSILKPRKGLNTSSPASEDGKNRWSTMSPLRSANSVASQSKSESRINTLGRFEGGDKLTTTEISLKENGVSTITKSGSFTEDKSESLIVKRMPHSNYDRPRSQVYTSTPLTGFVSPENHYDTPKTQSVLTPGGNGSQGKLQETYTSSSKPREVQYNTSVSKTLFPSEDKSREQIEKSDQRYDEVGKNKKKQGQQNQREGPLSPGNNASNDVSHNKKFTQELKSSKRTPIPADLSLNLQHTPSPVAPPRKQSSGSSGMLKSSSFSSPSSQNQSVVSPTAKPRKKWLTRQISLEPKKLDDDEFIGFASLPDQVHRKAVKRGFEFCLMVVGETGLGKSTLINSLFLTDLYEERKIPAAQECVDRTIEIIKKQLEIEERGVKVRLSVVDTPGFNDAVNGDENWRPVVEYVDRQFEQYFKAESGVNRKNIQDTRVHCCLYFISPYGHGLKPIDVLVMKKLHNKVNIVPLIAKSDILTPKEVKRLKLKVLEEIQKHNINIYRFPDCDSDEDEEFKSQNTALKSAIPFAVVGSNTVVEVAGKKIRGRMYPWGIVEVDNPKHCDFIKLRQMLISTHMQDLKDITADAHYENYRAEHLLSSEMQRSQRERTKLKRESIIGSDSLNDTDSLLAQKEAEIQRMQEMMIQLQAQLQNSPRGQVNEQARHT